MELQKIGVLETQHSITPILRFGLIHLPRRFGLKAADQDVRRKPQATAFWYRSVTKSQLMT
jgi:hypothetical protein